MHLKFEKMNLVMLTFSPLLLAMILFFMTRGETRMHDATHSWSAMRVKNFRPRPWAARRWP